MIKNFMQRVFSSQKLFFQLDLNSKISQTSQVSLYDLSLPSILTLITDTFINKSRVFLNQKKQFKQDQLWVYVHSSMYKQSQSNWLGFKKSRYLGLEVLLNSYSTGKFDKNELIKKQIPIIVLSSQKVVLTPLAQNDFQRLFKAASDPLIWEQHPNPNRYKREVFQKYFEGAIKSKGAFLISDAFSGNTIGCTRFYDFDSQARIIKIGYTFFSRDCWGGTYNQAVKSLMLNYVFNFVQKVHFEIGGKNIRSQKAIQRIGAQKIEEKVVVNYGEQPQVKFVYEIKK